ncbi:MAG: efflux RND transporter periplasmic adaptor subunit [Monoglobus pectinilyticus]
MDFFKKLFSKKNNDKDNIEQDFLNDAYNSLGEEHLNPERILDENSVSYKTDSENEIAEGEPVGTFGVHEREYENDRAENDENKFLKEASEHENIGFEQDNFENSGDRYDEDKSLDLKTDYEDIEDSGENSDFDEYINEDEDISEIEEFDPESAYDNLGGDTGEMDTEAISAAADMAQNLSTDELSDRRAEYGRDFIPSDNYISEEAQEETFSVSDEAGNNGSDINSLSDTRELEQTIPINSEIDKEEIYSAYAPKNMRPKVTQTSYFDLDNLDDEPEENLSDKGFRAFCKRRKKWLIGAGVAAAVVLVIVGTVFFFWNRMDPLMGYTQTYVAKGNVIKTMAAGGNVEPNARYDITSLVSGTIIETPLNAGEQVRAGELVYKIDDTNAQLAVQMAENDVKRAKVDDSDSGSSQQLRIYANASGTISDLNISAGSSITGGKIATITQANGTEFALIPNVTGTVQSVNVRNGSTVESGQVVATLKSDGSGSSKEGRELDIASCELALEQANKELEKYKIAAPIDGTILVKNAKIGDNVNANQTDKPLMVIADMSKEA